MKAGIILQERDFEILKTVFGHTVASFEELRLKHFGNIQLQTASNRIRRLVHAGFLKSYRVGLIIYQGKERQVNRIYTITPAGIQTLAIKAPDGVLRTDPVVPQFYSLVHDLLLNNVHDTLRKENPNVKIVKSACSAATPSSPLINGTNQPKNRYVQL